MIIINRILVQVFMYHIILNRVCLCFVIRITTLINAEQLRIESNRYFVCLKENHKLKECEKRNHIFIAM